MSWGLCSALCSQDLDTRRVSGVERERERGKRKGEGEGRGDVGGIMFFHLKHTYKFPQTLLVTLSALM